MCDAVQQRGRYVGPFMSARAGNHHRISPHKTSASKIGNGYRQDLVFFYEKSLFIRRFTRI
ncbi:hypothetical protein DT23_14890 [Thioclava indica]|uniref:Uncharacterized protein n=1 Tax=Thioclava indica TaxID=1353528 RepID=A0A074JWN3_9RHOB|nr:hypothetical protein DT23_14890 [Thioclava indica]